MMSERHVLYYDKDGNYLDHGRMIYKGLPKIGEIIQPFNTIKGRCSWQVVGVKIPPNDSCFEIYVNDLKIYT